MQILFLKGKVILAPSHIYHALEDVRLWGSNPGSKV